MIRAQSISQLRKLPAVCILYGTGEGPAHSKLLRQLLEEQGYCITKDADEADIILAHSGGYLLIPPATRGKVVLLAGPSNGYKGKSLLRAMAHKIVADWNYCIKHRLIGWWAYKTVWNVTYLLTRYRHHGVLLRGHRYLGKILPHFDAQRVGIILYRDDPWSWHLDKTKLMQTHPHCLISHPNAHDDLWMHPEQYVTILQYLYETRVLAAANHG